MSEERLGVFCAIRTDKLSDDQLFFDLDLSILTTV